MTRGKGAAHEADSLRRALKPIVFPFSVTYIMGEKNAMTEGVSSTSSFR